MKIVVLDAYCVNPGDISWGPVEALGELVLYDRTNPEDVLSRAADAEAILTNKVILDDAKMEALPRLEYIGILATGTNVVDLQAARERGITVTNIPAYSTDSVAQMVFAHILALTNRVEHYSERCHAGAWAESRDFCFWDSPLMELSGKRMGIVGMGNIGRKVAQIARSFGMDVAAVSSKTQEELPEGVTKMPLEEMLGTSDVVSLHCPLTPSTRHLIDADSISKMKPGAILVNTGRGPLVDEAALADALNSGRLAGAAIDVMEQEPPHKDNPLFSAANCLITPHIAWATREARLRLMDIAASNLEAYIHGHPVNCQY